MKKTLGFKLDLDSIKLLEEKASKEGKSKSQILKELVFSYISNNTTEVNHKKDHFAKEIVMNEADKLQIDDENHAERDNPKDEFHIKADENSSILGENDELKPDEIHQSNDDFQDDELKDESSRIIKAKTEFPWKIFNAIAIVLAIAAVGYIAYKKFIDKSKNEKDGYIGAWSNLIKQD